MDSNSTSKKFTKIIYEMSRTPVPEEIIELAKDRLADYLAVTMGGSHVNHSLNHKYLEQGCLGGESHVIGHKDKTSLNSTILLNAFNAHTLELDDGHRRAMAHMEAPIFSALLGVAEVKNCTVEQTLRAAVVGYETSVRIASAIQPGHKKRGFHASGTYGTIGCAMAVAALLQYDESEMQNVLSAAATSGAGLLEVITGKSEQKPYNVANAAVAGVNAALYGKLFTGPDDVLGGARGFARNLSSDFDIGQLLTPVKEFAIEGTYMKPYAACRHCHAPVEAALTLSKQEAIQPEDIKEIRVKTYDLAVYGHDHTEIDGINSAKMSIPYSVAVAYIKQKCGMEMFTEDMVTDGEILALTRKVTVEEDPDLSALVPAKRTAVVKVYAADGKGLEARVDYPKGEPENPISKKELQDKFYSLTGYAGVAELQAKAVLDFVYSHSENTIKQLFQIIEENDWREN